MPIGKTQHACAMRIARGVELGSHKVGGKRGAAGEFVTKSVAKRAK